MCGFSLLSIQNYHLSVLSVAVCYFSSISMYFYAFLTKKKSHNCYFQFVLARWCVGVHASNAFDTSVLKV